MTDSEISQFAENAGPGCEQEALNHLPKVSKETMSDVNQILDGCEDVQVLKHYLPILLDRYITDEDDEDPDQLISILYNISQLPPNALTITAQPSDTECLLSKLLSVRWGRRPGRDLSDTKECARIYRQTLDVDPTDERVPKLLTEELIAGKENCITERDTPSNANMNVSAATSIIPVNPKESTPDWFLNAPTLDDPSIRKRMCHRACGDWWDFENFPEPEEKIRLSDHFVHIVDTDILERLSYETDENIAVIEECQDFLLLVHYMCIFEERFQSTWHIEFLECQIAALRGIISRTSDLDLIHKLQRGIVMVLFHPSVLLRIKVGIFKLTDTEMIIGFARQALSRNQHDRPVREALYNGLFSLACCEGRSAELGRSRFKDHCPGLESYLCAFRYQKRLEEALECIQDDDLKRALILLKLLMLRIVTIRGGLSSLTISRDSSVELRDLMGWARPMFEEVWKRRHLIMSGGEDIARNIRDDMHVVLSALYLQTSGVEYLHRLVEIKSLFQSDENGPEDHLALVKKTVLFDRFIETLNLADLRSLLQLSEEEFSTKHRNGRGEIDYDLLKLLLDRYGTLYRVTESIEAAEKLQWYAHLAILNPSPEVNPDYDEIRVSSVKALILHFSSDRIRNVNSLREAVDVSALLHPDPRKSAFRSWEILWELGREFRALFQINWHIPTIEFAIFCLRRAADFQRTIEEHLVDKIPDVQGLVDLASTLFLRQDFLRSIIEYVPVDDHVRARDLRLTEALGGFMTLDSIYQTDRCDPPVYAAKAGIALRATMAKFLNEEEFNSDAESEWSCLLDLAWEMAEANKRKYPHRYIHGMGTVLRIIIYRAQFSGECMDMRARRKHLIAFKGAINLLQQKFTNDKRRTFRTQRGLIDDQSVVWKGALAVPFHVAFYAICWGEVQSAVELLDYGRSIIWSTMRRLRITESQLDGVSTELRSQFIRTCTEIDDTITLEPPPDPEELFDSLGSCNSKLVRVDQPSHVCVKREELEAELVSVIEKIRKVSGYDDFLQMLPFKKLQQAAREGPLIIVTMASRDSEFTVQTYRPKPLVGHAIIVLGNRDPVVVTLDAEGFEDRVNKVNKQLDHIRKKPGSADSNSELMKVLEEIGELFVKDVVAALISLGVTDQSRIWWCLTTVFSSFPVHAAMWRYEADAGKSRLTCLNDIYISSYTPSLAALIQARLPPSLPKVERSSRTSMLVIKQQDAQLATADKEVENIVLAASKAGHSFGDSFKLYNGDENERTDILKDLPDYDWIHLACHGVLDATDPFSSHFQISGGKDGVEKITIMDILRSRVPNAEFAFLSACHTAELPENFSREESLHLAAAMQFCGYRSVVGTLWPMNDEDGPRVAKAFYEYMFADPKEGEEVGYLRSARALNKVTQKMRRHPDYRQYPERWVNFVHIGA